MVAWFPKTFDQLGIYVQIFNVVLGLPEISKQYIPKSKSYKRKKSRHWFQCNGTQSNSNLPNGHRKMTSNIYLLHG